MGNWGSRPPPLLAAMQRTASPPLIAAGGIREISKSIAVRSE
jgi:hypothetical protein